MTNLYKEEHSEGIVLRSIPFKEHDRILTIFMQEGGVLALIVKRAQKLAMLSTPLCQAEFIYVKGKSDLYRFQDGTIIDDHLNLRSKFNCLQAAGQITKMVLHSQLPGKSAPLLYALLSSFLKQLPSFENPSILILAFQIKLLSHEGLISWESPSLFPFELKKCEWENLKGLAQTFSFQKLRELPPDPELCLKVGTGFKDFF